MIEKATSNKKTLSDDKLDNNVSKLCSNMDGTKDRLCSKLDNIFTSLDSKLDYIDLKIHECENSLDDIEYEIDKYKEEIIKTNRLARIVFIMGCIITIGLIILIY